MIEKIRDLKFSGKDKFFFLFTLLFFWGQGVLAFDTETLKSFYDCDELFCVKDDGSDKDAAVDGFSRNIGFQKKEVPTAIKFDVGQSSQRSEGRIGGGITTAGVPESPTAENPETAGEDPQDPAQARASGWGSGGAGGGKPGSTGGRRFPVFSDGCSGRSGPWLKSRWDKPWWSE